ncbi:MAG: hypothetical protein JWO86_6890 [Myxococcaceae bacterium]|jgi:hypothetical protein|nr:hypothetical protein [Myxococcaceae bacterium]MEA2752194.1 hypothetical protein [Myxococcales bacterium]
MGLVLIAATARDATAQEPSPTAQPPAPATQPAQPTTPPIAAGQIDLERDTQSTALADVPVAPAEAPPPPPYKKSLVIDSSLGALVFLGKFGQTAPPAPWIRTQIGYEIFAPLMVFAEGEIGFTDTSGTQDPPKTRAFPLFAFGGGARFTLRFTERFGVYVQGSLGAIEADVPKRALEIIGFKDAETLGLYVGGRLGLEWYQLDRHFALGVQSGLRDATGFKRTIGSDTPLVFDAGASIRYAF